MAKYRDMDEQIIRAVLKLLKKHKKLIEESNKAAEVYKAAKEVGTEKPVYTATYRAEHSGFEYAETCQLIEDAPRVLAWKETKLGDYGLDRWLHRVAILMPYMWD